MAAINYNFSIEQGSYFTITFIYQDENGLNIDLTNYCVVLQWIDNLGNNQIFTNRNKNINYDISCYSDGRIVFNLPAQITNSYTFDSAVYDLDIQEPNEQYAGSGYKTFRLSSGTISIIKRANAQTLLTNCIDIPFEQSGQAGGCPVECLVEDIYSILYNGQLINIQDSITNNSSIVVSDSRLIEKVEVVINGLNHKTPQDLQFILDPPTGEKILLSANQKIKHYIPGFNFIFSDDAPSDQFLHNIKNNQKCRIYDKTNLVKLNSETMIASLHSLNGLSAQGQWTLSIRDTDPGSDPGHIDSWGIIITYYS